MTMAETGAPPRAPTHLPQASSLKVLAEAGRRRAFAVISHPAAGKTTLTEALALHASAITQAGAAPGNAARRGGRAAWMAAHRARGSPATPVGRRSAYRDTGLPRPDPAGHPAPLR